MRMARMLGILITAMGAASPALLSQEWAFAALQAFILTALGLWLIVKDSP